MENKIYTDWTDYYRKPKSIISTLTQKITLKVLVRHIKKYLPAGRLRAMECGGGNSCFAASLSAALDVEYYDIVDKCMLGVEKAVDNNTIRNAWYTDLTKDIDRKILQEKYNFVYSVGLVEHFPKKARKKVIENHFNLCEKEGYVLITAPTPTPKYKFLRKCMELLRVWQFWDETPMQLEALVKEMTPYGEIVSAEINSKLPLTQCIVIARKK